MRSHLVALFSLFALSTAQSDADVVIEGRGAAPILPTTLEQGFTPLKNLGGLARRQTSSCRVGYTVCGSVCIQIGWSCCPDGRGGCGPADKCWPTSTGYGCCPVGKTCRGNAPAPSVSTHWSSYTSYTTTYDYSTRSSSTRSTSTRSSSSTSTRRSSSSSTTYAWDTTTTTDEDAATATTTAASTSTTPFAFTAPTLPSLTLPTLGASSTSRVAGGSGSGASGADGRVSLNVYLMTAAGSLLAAFGLLA